MQQTKEKLPSIPIGGGRGSYVLHEIGKRFYWYRHFYDPQLYSKTKDRSYSVKAVREDPPGHVGKGMSEIPSKDEVQILQEAIAAHDWGDGAPVSETEKCQRIQEGATALLELFNRLIEDPRTRKAIIGLSEQQPELFERIKTMEAVL